MPISLKPHNIETYQKVIDKMNESNRVAVIHPTGTGKMFIALKLLEENKGKKAIYLAPSNAILHDVKKNIFSEGMTMVDFPLLTRITYQKLANMSDEEIEKLDADIIILDEFHHCGAPEWGKGVEKLIQRNEGADVLGLSATPLRYFDGLRDMADELFKNNVASEMSLEEAIESGILPEATYVSSLYGYEQELENMQEHIDKIKDKNKHQQAQMLLNDLRGKLDGNTYNLSDLFSTYMQNPNGKYIVFCRNIEDMNEKIVQAQEMFERVNPNITVRAVSSKIKESDRILTEFEQDTDEGTLKLLYAVNMINEGYHIKDLDGVVMMRPTFSPTIFTQQLGRALTVGGDKKPVVLDLVNNFDSCKIIEDFAERMRQYKGRDGLGRTEETKRSRISIFDKTQEFREIAKKITELSSTKEIPLEEKIQIFEKFSQTGEELVGNTIFEGYPIGQWAIQIRNGLNRINNGKQEKQTINPTKEQLERLKKLGILERQIDSTIDEKIDSLVEWLRKYPKATIVPIVSNEILNEYAKTEVEQKQLMEEYKKMLKYYEYVRTRKSRGKLDENQIEKCRDGNVGGVFGKNTEVNNAIESETDKLIKKYGLNEETINLIRKQYGSIDEFRKIYIHAVINHNVDQVIPKKILENANLIREFDLSSSDWVLKNNGLAELICDITGVRNIFIKYEGFEDKFIELIRENNFSEQEKQVLFMLYGINGENKVNQAQIAKSIGKSSSRVHQIAEKSIRRIRFPQRFKQLQLKNRVFDIDYDLEKKIIEEYFKNFDIFVSKESTSMDEDVKNKLTNMLYEGVKKTKKRSEQVDIIERMSEEEKMDILKARFGEKIKRSDISVAPPGHYIYRAFDGTDSIELADMHWWRLNESFFLECVDSEYAQSKIVEFMVNRFSNSELIEVGKKEEIEEFIVSNGYFSEEKKNELKDLLRQRIRVAVKENILKDIEALAPSISLKNLAEMTIEELDLSVRSFNCIIRAGIKTVQDLVEKSEEDLMKVRNLGKKSYDEVIEKLQSLGIKIVDGHFEFASTELPKDSKEQTNNVNESTIRQIEEKINSSDVLSEDEKEMLEKELREKYQKIKVEIARMEEQSLYSEIMGDVKTISDDILEMPIEDLDLSVRTFNCITRAGIKTVQGIVKKSEEDLMGVRNLGKKSYDEVIEKLESLGIEIVDGDFICKNSHNTASNTDIKKMRDLEKRINSSECISQEKKEELRKLLYKTFNITRDDNQGIQNDIETSKNYKSSEEISKEELVKHILEQQRTIANQTKEINELSSQKKEGINK